MLIYRDPAWLSFALEGLAWSKNETPYRVLVVGNDAERNVCETGRLDIDHRNENPNEHYLARVYRAWNRAVEESKTELVCLINSDMYVSDYWLDELVEVAENDPRSLPCSLLVESGRIESAMPEHASNLGLLPDTFDRQRWQDIAGSKRAQGRTEEGRLFMPVLFRRADFLRVGGYPIGNPTGTTGDRDLFARFAGAGYRHLTALGSVVYHVQEGEMRG
jgi:GT2 family glycosyltransferase